MNQPDTARVDSSAGRLAIDIGSTVVKVARLGPDDAVVSQKFHERDFDLGIAKQVESLVEQVDGGHSDQNILMCSSANGGLRVGIVCMSDLFSGHVLRDQVLMAGGNPLFVTGLESSEQSTQYVDVLLVGGGIDCADCAPMEKRVKGFDPSRYRFDLLMYAGNAHCAGLFLERCPDARIVDNPLGDSLLHVSDSVFESLRRVYLDDLVHKEGISELRTSLSAKVLPTPEIVSQGFQRITSNQSSIKHLGACMLFDVGGATTDLHYTIDIVRDGSGYKMPREGSTARYVFPDLGVVASSASTGLVIRNHPRLYEFLDATMPDNVVEVYRSLREGEYELTADMLAYACLFVGLDRAVSGNTAGLPLCDIGKVNQVILTGGALQACDPKKVIAIFGLFVRQNAEYLSVMIDRAYEVWIEGMTWNRDAAPVASQPSE